LPDVESPHTRLVMTDTDSPESLRDRNRASEVLRILSTKPSQYWYLQRFLEKFRKKSWPKRVLRKMNRIARSTLSRLPLVDVEQDDPTYEYSRQVKLLSRKFDRVLERYRIPRARTRVTLLLAESDATRPDSLVRSWCEASGDKIDLLWYPGPKNVNTREEPARSVVLAQLGRALGLGEEDVDLPESTS